jgi:hypothetical protein
MQKLPIYLYTNLFEVTLDLDKNRGIHQIMYQRTLKIQKGVKNTIQLQFKNSDQKRVGISSSTFKINVFDPVDRKLVMSKDVTVLDNASTTTNALKGLAEISFLENETLKLDSKSYNFAIVKSEDDGSYSPTYSNTYYDVAGTLEIKDEIYPSFVPSFSMSDFQRSFNGAAWEYSTGNLRVYPDSIGTLHTAAFYMTNYRGTVLVEGTLENSPSINPNYALISTKVYNQFTGIDYVNFNGVFNYIRVRYIPTTNTTGTFDKLLLRS